MGKNESTGRARRMQWVNKLDTRTNSIIEVEDGKKQKWNKFFFLIEEVGLRDNEGRKYLWYGKGVTSDGVGTAFLKTWEKE